MYLFWVYSCWNESMKLICWLWLLCYYINPYRECFFTCYLCGLYTLKFNYLMNPKDRGASHLKRIKGQFEQWKPIFGQGRGPFEQASIWFVIYCCIRPTTSERTIWTNEPRIWTNKMVISTSNYFLLYRLLHQTLNKWKNILNKWIPRFNK